MLKFVARSLEVPMRPPGRKALRSSKEIRIPGGLSVRDSFPDEELFFSVVSLGEICKGIGMPPVSEAVAERWGLPAGDCQLKGRRHHARKNPDDPASPAQS
jgi:hypothetical protein